MRLDKLSFYALNSESGTPKKGQSNQKSSVWYRALGCKWLWLIAAFRSPAWSERGEWLEGRRGAGAKAKDEVSIKFVREVQHWGMLPDAWFAWPITFRDTETQTLQLLTVIMPGFAPISCWRTPKIPVSWSRRRKGTSWQTNKYKHRHNLVVA